MANDTAVMQISLIELATKVVAAYVARNHVAVHSLPALIETVHSSISRLALAEEETAAPVEPEKPTPAQIRRSLRHDAIISFIDGKRYQTLKRHLTKHGLSPNSYRARFGLAADYPMIAPAYSERRAGLAKKIGLGVRNR